MAASSPTPGTARAGFEDAIRRFEVAWQGPTRPDILAYLLEPGSSRLLTELVHVDLEYRLRAGEAARIEDYLTRYPALSNERDAALELIAAEYDLRRRTDSRLAVVDYVRRFPP